MKSTLALALSLLAASTQLARTGVTPEQAKILEHMSLVEVPDGAGSTVTTVVLSGVNVQIVNGMGSTESANGAGNLILGYNEPGNFEGDLRTGSHCLVYGMQANYTTWQSLVGGIQNSAYARRSVLLTGQDNLIDVGAFDSAVVGGSGNTIRGTSSFIGGGSRNTCAGFAATILGGYFNRAGEGAFPTVVGGQSNRASGDYSTVSGGFNRALTGANAWRGGGLVQAQ